MGVLKEENGQMSFEYLLLFIISLILINVFILPMISTSIDSIDDLNTAYNTKSQMEELVTGINQVYASGSGSKRTVYLNMKKDSQIDINNGILTSDVLLSDNSYKKVEVRSNDLSLNNRITLNRGLNRVIIEWKGNSSQIEIGKI
ncbi:hypothetical protein [Methanobrevibacter sp. AbM4]|uniref:hypothetical protein n=1 Tax=Methanobrevibacter sp. AbM4 TaxID=224719 RepID=UPI00033481F9|nr:hypothetical protein [Methanobrevibacter sp. AbM4]AGN16711.1 hypothetical protein Abm4_0820 [Methanobrevibacter sp. AbM4]